ncbi:MAG: DUF881 domain-containing protein [Candidatus Phosphoribacter sp.]|nr:DUF881 domain-containing protein [Actinomycetales bacterium]
MPPSASPTAPQRSWRFLVPGVFALAGLLFATSFQTAGGSDLRIDRGLPGLIDQANRDVASRTALVAGLQGEIDALTAARSAADPGNTDLAALTATANLLAASVGTRAVEGPVLAVTLTDSSRTQANLPPSVRADDLVVHQQDVQAVVNALWRGGAEAMMIQDQRIIATSAIRCVGNTLILQGRVYAPPFVIRAIGRIDALRESLDADPQIAIYQQWVDAVGLGYAVSTTAKARFPAYSGSVALSFAKVVR